MKLTTVSLSNIKSFKNTTEINLNDHLTILIGPNGGGKSNLLDCLSIFLRNLQPAYNVASGVDGENLYRDIGSQSLFSNLRASLERHKDGPAESSMVVKMRITKGDLDNFAILQNAKHTLQKLLVGYRNKPTHSFDFVDQWSIPPEGTEVTFFYSSDRGNIYAEDSTSMTMLEYLRWFNLFVLIIHEEQLSETYPLRPSLLFFPPHRSESSVNLVCSLASEDYYSFLHAYMSATSKTTASLVKLSSLYFAGKRRRFEGQASSSGWISLWDNDKDVKLVSSHLSALGYEWDIKPVDPLRNTYVITLRKENREFSIQQASSGEKEIINFILGMFAFSLKEGIVIVDEPELHLHPKWQALLLNIFLQLSRETGNQFIVSTHSASFITRDTVNYVTRIYRDPVSGSSTAVQCSASGNTTKDYIHIINAHNNEKIFFCDKVILVEGIHDRVLFESVLSSLCSEVNPGMIIEVLEVHGTQNFSKYRLFLDGLGVSHVTIADLDYISTIGSPEVKQFLRVNEEKLLESLLGKKSLDGRAFLVALEGVLRDRDYLELEHLLNYVRLRHQRLCSLTPGALEAIGKFVLDQRENDIYLLSRGEIENYLPAEYRKIDHTIEFVNGDEFPHWLDMDGREIRDIIREVIHGRVKLCREEGSQYGSNRLEQQLEQLQRT